MAAVTIQSTETKKQKLRMPSAKWIGHKFGRLTVMSFSHRARSRYGDYTYLYTCRCDCGTVKPIVLSMLRRKNPTVSCGCYQKEMLASRLIGNTLHRLPLGQAALNGLFSSYKHTAKKRGVEFEFTVHEFAQITSRPCYYCKAPPMSKYQKGPTSYGSYYYNGIDRVDNDKGYTKDNCVTCCKLCNGKKNGITKDMVCKLYHLLFTPSQ